MEADLKVIRRMEDVMVTANFIIKKEAFMMGSGKTIICMGMENFIMLTAKSPMKGLGLMISFTGMGKCIMTFPLL